jgi:predicted ATPase/class 3 adenylate cyclase
VKAFLFTDIESSTRLWEEHPKEMALALARHDEIMRASIAANRGELLKTTGDGAIAIFGYPADAIGAGIRAQEQLQAETWETTPLRVRMGVHAGETQVRDDDHFGPAMNRAARIMAAGHGEQVLVSRLARDLAGAELAGEISFRDLGSHRLKDLTEPEHLYQLIHPGLRSEFPELKTLDARPNNLPLQANEFLGRAEELSAIHRLLDNPSTRLLTLVGSGGTGKTRLGLQVAADRSDSYRDGVWFVDLAADTFPDDAYETIIRVLDLPVSRIGATIDVLKTQLRDKQMLIVLDNLEQVIEAGAGIGQLLQSAPDLEMIVTSRETLRVRGEHVYAVPPMGLPDPAGDVAEISQSEAARLFIERATAADPGFTLNEQNASAVAAICVRLDGLPLAIELAAARLNVFSPEDLLARISERLDVLASASRDLPERQRTLWGAIAWSYELLSGDEPALFGMLSVFAGGALPAIESVASEALGAATVVDTLSSLVDKSLVRTQKAAGSLRFGLLQMIKEYAADRLAESPGLGAAVSSAHASYYARLAADERERIHGSQREAAVEVLEADIDNLRLAWQHWVAAGDVDRLSHMVDSMWALHDARGWYHGAVGLADDMLTVMKASDPSEEMLATELTLRASQARALMAIYGYNLEVEQAFQRALALAESVGNMEDRLPVMRALASYYIQTADFPKAADLGRELLELGNSLGNEGVEIEAHSVIASTMLYSDPATCLDHLDYVISRYDPGKHGAGRYRLGPDTGTVARMSFALVLWETGKLGSAVQRADQAVEFATHIDHPYSLAWAFYHRGFLAVARGRFDDVRQAADQLRGISAQNDYALWSTLATVLEGVALSGLGQPDRGLELTEKGIELYQGLAPPPVFWPLMLALRAGVYAAAGDPTRALGLIDEAIGIWNVAGLVPPELNVRRSQLLLALRGPDDPEVEQLLEQAAAAARQLGMALAELKAHTGLVQLRRLRRQADDGSADLGALYDAFQEGFDELDLVAARALLDR